MLTNYGLANKLTKRVGSKQKPKLKTKAFTEHNQNLLDISDHPNFAQTQFLQCQALLTQDPCVQKKKKKQAKRGGSSSALRSSRSSLSKSSRKRSGKKENDLNDLIMSTALEHHHLVYQTPKREEFDGMALIDNVIETSPQTGADESAGGHYLECIPSENESSSMLAGERENQIA